MSVADFELESLIQVLNIQRTNEKVTPNKQQTKRARAMKSKNTFIAHSKSVG